MKNRAVPLRHEALQADQEDATLSALEQYQYVATANRQLAERYQQMSTVEYWEEIYATSEATLLDSSQWFVDLADKHQTLAATYAEQAQLALDSLGHLELVGDNGEIQDDLYTYDDIGNLTARVDYAVDLHEDFTYDSLNRLQNSQLSGLGAELYQMVGLNSIDFQL